jgi:hypothetical protein
MSSTTASHKLLSGCVIEKRCEQEHHRGPYSHHQQRRFVRLKCIDAQVDEDHRQQYADDCVSTVRVARSLGGGPVAPDEFVEGGDFLFARTHARETVADIYRAGMAKSLVAVLANGNRIGALMVEALHRSSTDFSLYPGLLIGANA